LIARHLEAALPAGLPIALLICRRLVITLVGPLTLTARIGVRAAIASVRRISGGRTELASGVLTTFSLRPTTVPVTIRRAILWPPVAAPILTARHLEAARCHAAT
jgi:hypothetical protein